MYMDYRIVPSKIWVVKRHAAIFYDKGIVVVL